MLEQPRKSGAKVISHLLASHGGEIFVHAINTARSLLEDPPSISEGCGGRVTDYSINVRIIFLLHLLKKNSIRHIQEDINLISIEILSYLPMWSPLFSSHLY